MIILPKKAEQSLDALCFFKCYSQAAYLASVEEMFLYSGHLKSRLEQINNRRMGVGEWRGGGGTYASKTYDSDFVNWLIC